MSRVKSQRRIIRDALTPAIVHEDRHGVTLRIASCGAPEKLSVTFKLKWWQYYRLRNDLVDAAKRQVEFVRQEAMLIEKHAGVTP